MRSRTQRVLFIRFSARISPSHGANAALQALNAALQAPRVAVWSREILSEDRPVFATFASRARTEAPKGPFPTSQGPNRCKVGCPTRIQRGAQCKAAKKKSHAPQKNARTAAAQAGVSKKSNSNAHAETRTRVVAVAAAGLFSPALNHITQL